MLKSNAALNLSPGTLKMGSWDLVYCMISTFPRTTFDVREKLVRIFGGNYLSGAGFQENGYLIVLKSARLDPQND